MKKWNKDYGLQFRMIFTMFLLAAVYLFFLIFLSTVMGVGTHILIAFMGIFLFVQFYYSDKIALKSMGAKIVTEQEEPHLHKMISRLCAIADLSKPKIAIMQSSIPNAFATGRNEKNAVVAVTTALINKLNKSELEAVLAHELSHIKNKDMVIITIASFLSTVAFFLVRNMLFFGMGGRNSKGGGAMIAIWVVSLIVWVVSFILIRTLSRYREFSADKGASIITGNPSHLASALMKISGVMDRVPSQDLRKAEGMNAFFIIPAMNKQSIMNLFSTHPTVEARVKALSRLEESSEVL
ncbi:MAG: zinc metalloprotease HtpX [Methanosarcinaceae archaeon]|nr:zinc metalloprotease HtpX [Methanosarcinaceae archaeon]